MTTTLTHVRACHLAAKFEVQEVVKMVEKDVEAVRESEDEALGRALSRASTVGRVRTLELERQRSVEEVAQETRLVYGPSVPPFT